MGIGSLSVPSPSPHLFERDRCRTAPDRSHCFTLLRASRKMFAQTGGYVYRTTGERGPKGEMMGTGATKREVPGAVVTGSHWLRRGETEAPGDGESGPSKADSPTSVEE